MKVPRFPYSFRFVGSENSPQPARGPGGARPRPRSSAEQLRDLPRRQVGAVAERDQLAVALVELRDRSRHASRRTSSSSRSPVARPRPSLIRRRLGARPAVDAAAGDPDQPGDRLALRRVVARAVAERALERLTRHVLGFGAGADPVGDVGVDRRISGSGLARGSPRNIDGSSGRCGRRRSAGSAAWLRERAPPLGAVARPAEASQSSSRPASFVDRLPEARTRAARGLPAPSCASPRSCHGSDDHGAQRVRLPCLGGRLVQVAAARSAARRSQRGARADERRRTRTRHQGASGPALPTVRLSPGASSALGGARRQQ